jgi:hypothetical protein
MSLDLTQSAVDYLRRRLDATHSGDVTLASAAAAVRAALASGVSLKQITHVLSSYGLCWESATRTVRFC